MERSTAAGKTAAIRFLLLVALLTFPEMISCVRQCDGDGVVGSKERILKQDLFTLREQIDNYTIDKEKPPQSLRDLVVAGYLKKIPKDPFTGSETTWIAMRESIAGNNRAEAGITDVHSGSNASGCDGTPYASW